MSILNNNDEFIVLFGSVARNDFDKYSDIDILNINTKEKMTFEYESLLSNLLPQCFPNHPTLLSHTINSVSYDSYAFDKFYNDGSLFLYHVFTQGKLLSGNKLRWKKLTENFRVATNFDNEISSIINNLHIFHNTRIFGGLYVSALSNLYSLLKNYCIFKLANKGIYQFNKYESIRFIATEFKYNDKDIYELKKYYDTHARGLTRDLIINPNTIRAKDLINNTVKLIEKIENSKND